MIVSKLDHTDFIQKFLIEIPHIVTYVTHSTQSSNNKINTISQLDFK